MLVVNWKRCLASILVVVLGLGALAACSPPQPPGAAASSRAISVDVAPATMGTINVTTVHAAVVAAKEQVDVVPMATGRVGKLTVHIGSKVQKGQLIAELSHGTLDAQLQKAEAALAAVKAAAKPNEIKARAQVSSARAALIQLLNPSSSDLQIAQSAVATADSSLDSAKIELEQLLNPSAAELADAQADLAAARSALNRAQAEVDLAISVETSAVGLAEYDIDLNPVLLDAALANLNLLKNPTPADFAAVEAAAAFAERSRVANQRLLGRQTAETAAGMWGVLLIARQGLVANTATLSNPTLDSALTPDELASAQRIVAVNQKVIASLLTELNSDFLVPESIRTAMWVESKAMASSEAAKAALEELQNPNQDRISLAENEVDEAQALLDGALAKLNLLKHPNPADLADAEASVAVAEQTLALNEGAYSNYAIQAAQAQVNLVKQQMAELRVLAPFDGFVSQVWLSPGATTSSQTPIVTVISGDVVLSFLVEETSIGSLSEGQRVTFTSPALPGQYLELRIDAIAPAGDEKSHTFAVRMRPQEPTHNLKPGMSGQVSVSIRQENVVLVPKEAVLRQGGQSTLFVVQDGKAHLRQVGVGLIDDWSMEIRSGIQPGDQVVVSSRNQLNEGDPVIIESSSHR